MEKRGEFGEYEKVDADTVKFTLALDGRAKKAFEYSVRLHRKAAEEKEQNGE